MEENMEIIRKEQGVILLDPNFSKKVAELEKKLKELKEQEEKIKLVILNEMERNDILKLDSEDIVITYVAATDRESFNSKKFREDNAELYDKYIEIKPVSPSIRLKVK